MGQFFKKARAKSIMKLTDNDWVIGACSQLGGGDCRQGLTDQCCRTPVVCNKVLLKYCLSLPLLHLLKLSLNPSCPYSFLPIVYTEPVEPAKKGKYVQAVQHENKTRDARDGNRRRDIRPKKKEGDQIKATHWEQVNGNHQPSLWSQTLSTILRWPR